ncbi:MAG: hypothetical protein HDR82_09680 [Bacteroides sp.]|nr:hypothetical protein [Bacteroides sp.]
MRFIYIVILLVLVGCAPTKYVPVESVGTEYREVDTTAIYNRLLRLFESRREKETCSDSLFDREKETLVLRENGDTARHDRERIVYRSTNREKELESKVKQQENVINELRTKLSSVKNDSIRLPYPVERELSQWERSKMDLGGIAMGGLAVAVCVAVIWLIKRMNR